MLTTTKTAERQAASALVEGRKSYISDLQAWHKRLHEKQVELESTFDLRKVNKWSVNVWDDFPEGGTTYAYVEMDAIPDVVCVDLLMHLLAYAKSNRVINDSDCALSLRFYDSSSVHPVLIGSRVGEYSMFKRWEMTITGASYESLDLVVQELKKAPDFQDKPFKIYSES
jgi:hypothetical protein